MSETNYYQKNRDIILNRAKEYYKNNKDVVLNKAKEKYKNNRGLIKHMKTIKISL